MIPIKKRRKIRAKRIAQHYKHYLKQGDKVLDIGCGDGKLALELKSALKIKLNLIGTDVLNYKPEFKFKLIKNEKLPFKNKEFNVSMFNDVLHHIPYEKQVKIIKEALRVSNKVLIYEVSKSLTGKFVDIITNKLHDRKVKLPLTMRSLEEWTNLFKQNNLKFKYYVVNRSMNQFFLLKNYCFILEK